jgi:hypothetical protein
VTYLFELSDSDLSRVLSDVSVENLGLQLTEAVRGDQVVALGFSVCENNSLSASTCRSGRESMVSLSGKI